MKKRKDAVPNVESADVLAHLFENFDYRVDTDDFLLYELGRLIEEDRASFEDAEFRRIIDEGMREHVEEQLEIRALISMRLRGAFLGLDEATRRIALRAIHALEDVDFPLHNVSLIVRTYTAYMFGRLLDAADESGDAETEARQCIERWQSGEILREQMMAQLRKLGRTAVGPLADLLFDAPEDRASADAAIEVLGSIRSSSSARVLAHAVFEPILPEDLEQKAYSHVRALWPLPRHYVIYNITQHSHEDLPFRWFQILVETGELDAVDLILNELLVHAGDPAFREDLAAIIELLRLSRDPDIEQKIVGVINAPDTAPEGARLLEGFLADFRPSVQPADNPWSHAARLADLNKRYRAAARLFETGKPAEALRSLNMILEEEPQYPFALALKRLL